jgi:hypothetical protein
VFKRERFNWWYEEVKIKSFFTLFKGSRADKKDSFRVNVLNSGPKKIENIVFRAKN